MTYFMNIYKNSIKQFLSLFCKFYCSYGNTDAAGSGGTDNDTDFKDLSKVWQTYKLGHELER